MEHACPDCGTMDMHNLVYRTRVFWLYECRECGREFEVPHEDAMRGAGQ